MLSSASTTQAYYVLRFPLPFIDILQGIAAGTGTSNFLRAAFIVSLNSSLCGSMKIIPDIVKFWFLDSPSLFSFHFGCIRHLLPHIWPYIIWTRGCSFPRKSPHRPCVSVSFDKMDLVKPVHATDNSLSLSIHVPVIFNIFLQQYIQGCV